MGCSGSSQTSAVDTTRPSVKPGESNGTSTTGAPNENGNIAEDSETIPEQTPAGDAKPADEHVAAAPPADNTSAAPPAVEEPPPAAASAPEEAAASAEAAAPESPAETAAAAPEEEKVDSPASDPEPKTEEAPGISTYSNVIQSTTKNSTNHFSPFLLSAPTE
ncbi:uncharacterized protein AB9W97_001275 isoform 1-T2 [Spinachia spinachia]